MNMPLENTAPSPTTTTDLAVPHGPEPILGTKTSSTAGPTYSGSDSYPVFPNNVYLSKFALVSSQDSGLTDLDIDLYNECYLPANPLSYHNDHHKRDEEDKDEDEDAPKPEYLIDRPPCKRASAINTNCHFQNTNGTFPGLQTYSDEFDVQQECYCEVYPYFDSVLGCMECFRRHGGVAGYHYFPPDYVNAVSSTYCAADPQTTEFYAFVSEWAKTAPAAKVSRTTAADELGTQTAASLYYTYAASTATGMAAAREHPGVSRVLVVALALGAILCR